MHPDRRRLLVQWTLALSCGAMGLSSATALAQPNGKPAYPADLQPTKAHLAYAADSPAQTLDLFLPAGDGPFPLVINIHGGGFRMGSKAMLDPAVARAWLQSGVAVASIDYRLSGEALFPAAVQDAKAAVRFLRARATAFRLDAGRFMAFGQSAGGNLASLLGVTGDSPVFDHAGMGDAQVSSRVQGVIDWFGPTDFAQMDAQARAQGCPASAQTHASAGSPESAYLGAPLAQVPERVRLANPITHVTAAAPPFLLQKGGQDCSVPVGQSQLLYQALKAAGVPVTYELLPEGGHGDRPGAAAVFSSPANVQRLVQFVQATLR